MPKVSEKFASKFLKTEDFDKEGRILTISTVIEEEIGRGQNEKLVMFFKEMEEGFPLNRTNAETIADELGDDTDGWEGESIRVFRDKTMFNGKRVDCLRVRVEKE